MNKKISIIIIILILLVSNIFAAMQITQALSWALSVKEGTWTIKALSAVSPEVGEAVSFVINPQGKVLSEGVSVIKDAVGPEASKVIDGVLDPKGVLTTEALTEFAKENPEEAGNLAEALTIKSQLERLGFKEGEVKLDKDGLVEEIDEFEIPADEKGNPQDISALFYGSETAEKLTDEQRIIVKDFVLSKKEGNYFILTAKENSFIKINDREVNLAKGHIELVREKDAEGNIVVKPVRAYLTIGEDGGTLKFAEEEVTLKEGTRVLWDPKNGYIFPKQEGTQLNLLDARGEKFSLKLGNSDVRIITIDGISRISGNAKINDILLIEGTVGLEKEGYLLKKKTILNGQNLKISAWKEEVLFANVGADVSTYENWIKPEETLGLSGTGFTVKLEKGAKWIDVSEEALLAYTLYGKGGDIKIRDGKVKIKTNHDGIIIEENNGDKFIYSNEKVKEFISHLLFPEEERFVPIETSYEKNKVSVDEYGTVTINDVAIIEEKPTDWDSLNNLKNNIFGKFRDEKDISKKYPLISQDKKIGERELRDGFAADINSEYVQSLLKNLDPQSKRLIEKNVKKIIFGADVGDNIEADALSYGGGMIGVDTVKDNGELAKPIDQILDMVQEADHESRRELEPTISKLSLEKLGHEAELKAIKKYLEKNPDDEYISAKLEAIEKRVLTARAMDELGDFQNYYPEETVTAEGLLKADVSKEILEKYSKLRGSGFNEDMRTACKIAKITKENSREEAIKKLYDIIKENNGVGKEAYNAAFALKNLAPNSMKMYSSNIKSKNANFVAFNALSSGDGVYEGDGSYGAAGIPSLEALLDNRRVPPKRATIPEGMIVKGSGKVYIEKPKVLSKEELEKKIEQLEKEDEARTIEVRPFALEDLSPYFEPKPEFDFSKLRLGKEKSFELSENINRIVVKETEDKYNILIPKKEGKPDESWGTPSVFGVLAEDTDGNGISDTLTIEYISMKFRLKGETFITKTDVYKGKKYIGSRIASEMTPFTPRNKFPFQEPPDILEIWKEWDME